MNDVSFDTLARDTQAPQGRRVALKALGLAALGAVAGAPLAADAKNNGGDNNNKKRKKRRNRGGAEQECPPEDCTQEAEAAAAARCLTQVAQCEQLVRDSCGNDANCILGLLPCCEIVGTCDLTGFFSCIVTQN